MNIGQQMVLWRRHRRWGQAEVAEKAGITRPYLSRIETGQADPSLSTLRRLATALDLTVGELVDFLPPRSVPNRNQLDKVACAVFHPGTRENKNLPYVRALAAVFHERRAALGLIHPRKTSPLRASSFSSGARSLRRLRTEWGEEIWQALLKRIDKHAFKEQKRIQ
jgi:transcriptional regulator with XRE-family HTH domain